MRNPYSMSFGLVALTALSLYATPANATITVAQTGCSVTISTNTFGNGGYNPGCGCRLDNYHFQVTNAGGFIVANSYQASDTYQYRPTERGTYKVTVSTAQNTGGCYFNTIGQRVCDARAYTITESVTYQVGQVGSWNFGTLSRWTNIERSNNGYALAVGAGNQVFYGGADGWVKHYYYDNGWHLSWPTQTWNANEKITGGLAVAKPSNQLFYRGADGKVDTYYWTPTNGWQHTWLTRSWSSSENVDYGPYTISVGKDNAVAYAGADKWVHLYTFNGATGQWDHRYLTSSFDPSERVANVVSASVVDGKVFYKGLDNKMHLYYLDNGRWVHTWLTQNWSNNNENVGGQIVVNNDCSAVYFTGADGWVHRYYWANNTWNHEWLTTTFNTYEQSSGPLSVGANDQVFFRNNSDVRNYYRDNGVWYSSYLVQDWGNAVENAHYYTQVQVGEGNQVFYSDENGFINTYYYGNCYARRGVANPTGSSTTTAAPSASPAARNSTINSETSAIQPALFPNPAHERATLSYPVAEAQALVVEITNTLGQVVLRQEIAAHVGRNDIDLDVSQLSAGLHTLTVHGTGPVYRTKLTVAR
jgi:hypothetical protein